VCVCMLLLLFCDVEAFAPYTLKVVKLLHTFSCLCVDFLCLIVGVVYINPGSSDIGLCDTLSLALGLLSYQLIPPF
jgi:hypothetical protein